MVESVDAAQPGGSQLIPFNRVFYRRVTSHDFDELESDA